MNKSAFWGEASEKERRVKNIKTLGATCAVVDHKDRSVDKTSQSHQLGTFKDL